ncbi:hypothetical protein EMIHUDRAFT_223642 [Emiliania huxleyi CCMP1516]|uniref:Dipeptidase n=2 Tax=Emiliania huxleyi TaxID=2903 RepID=A0A0D3KTT7_EMIH1|nr:hypothetical protein EMIHUDRAFT_223642 [Emiliania huxleyi CCMP1516]EOD39172.1 hypothetical protein EMIHUDRAFT_223642 [Emiliania huxleyi CCMP1516]|eukprot:XP_005791601.1 hypothetical protein EMIHUDRAFT_223642 [Emiliania huxleyi CCMP1516]
MWATSLLVALAARHTTACTTLIVGKDASVDGSVMATHSDDGESNPDARVVYVPAMDHAPGATRPIYYDTEDFPRFVGDRGVEAYLQKNNPGFNASVPIGHIPQVEHTFGYFEATYGILNEHQVGIGESTCSSVFGAQARGHGGHALFSVDSLSRIALERSKSAREAVQLMGDLAVAEGFYGAGSFEGTGESLMVIDPREGFIFHVLPDHSGKSAVWAAQRVGDGQVGVVANMFTIRHLLPNRTTRGQPDFLFSDSVHEIAQRSGWWRPSDGPLDFTRVYSDGEYAHKFYSGRRLWGAYRLLAPDVPMPSDYSDLRPSPVYPATVSTRRKLSPLDLIAVHRDMYQGTPFDMTAGAAAGAFANPDRYSASGVTKLRGAWERSIALYRTSQTHARGWLPPTIGGVAWYGPHAAHGTCFLPLHIGAQAVPAPHADADPRSVSRRSAYWAHKFVLNLARARYSDMMGVVRAVQRRLEAAAWERVRADSPAAAAASLAATSDAEAEVILAEWWALPDELMLRFADGWASNGPAMGYVDAWLKRVGWEEGPPEPPRDPALPRCCQDTSGGAASFAMSRRRAMR